MTSVLFQRSFDERGLERAEPRRELAEEALVDGSLVLVCIEAAERKPDRRHAGRVGGELRGDAHRVAERAAREFGGEACAAVQPARGLGDIGLDAQDS